MKYKVFVASLFIVFVLCTYFTAWYLYNADTDAWYFIPNALYILSFDIILYFSIAFNRELYEKFTK